MKKTLAFLLLFFVAALLFTVQAQSTKAIRKKVLTTADSGRRSALVIGNAAYASKPLRNSVNDARAMSSTLRELGFSVELLEDASQKDMKKAIDRFGLQLRDGGTGLFYFSGHGIQVSGRNYLIPVKYTITSEDDVEYESVDAGRVLAKMKAARNGMNIVILDACRNNPFPSSFRSASQGLATINAPSGTFISYATAPGSVASDGSGNIGLYTGELIRHMKSPGLKLEEVFKKVRADVQKKSSDKQVPWDASSLTGDFYFVPPTVAPDSAPEVTGTAAVTDSASKSKVSVAPRKFRADEEMWELVKESNDPDDFKYFLEEFPESPLNSVARLKLRKLKKAQKKLAAKQKPASSSQSAIISQSKPKNSVESSLPQKNISIKEGFEKCEGRDFCLRKVANTNSMTLFSLKRMAKVYAWKGADKEKQSTSKTTSRASIRQTYDKAVKQNSIFGFRNFIKEYKHEPKAKYYLSLVKKKLKKLEGANETTTTSSSEASSGYTKRQAYLDFLEAKASNRAAALRRFISKHSGTPGADGYLQRARLQLQKLE